MAEPARLPDWPLLMDRATAARFLTYTRAEFNALVLAGLIPPPREHLPGKPRWHREELEACMARLWDLRRERERQDAPEEDLDARLRRFHQAPRGAKAGRRDDVPLLPPRRRLPPATGT